ncbi:MAG TPA: NAD-binding protein [Gaiellaceae bacterium]|nr:NAD-binding protein [Gaiellaceae bacterium]
MLDESYWRRFAWAVATFAAVLAVGTVGFQILLDEGWVDSFYRSVVSTTLTGLASAPDTDAGKIFTVVLLFAGVAVFFYIAGVVVDAITRGVLSDVFGERRRRREIEELRDHVIICGYGRVGRSVAAEFRATGTPFVVVDVTPESVALAQRDGSAVVLGDGTEDEDLERAGLARARGLVASVDSDEKNLYITLSARARRPDLFIAARASTEAAASKIRLAGANRVVQPYSHAGLQLANLVVKPQVADFLDIVTTAAGPMPELRFEEIEVTSECGRVGATLGELDVQARTGAVVVALRREDGAFEATPGDDIRLAEGDVVIGVGTADEMRRLEELFAPREATVG